jgi:lipoprotein-releasing system ATP-binding protein
MPNNTQNPANTSSLRDLFPRPSLAPASLMPVAPRVPNSANSANSASSAYFADTVNPVSLYASPTQTQPHHQLPHGNSQVRNDIFSCIPVPPAAPVASDLASRKRDSLDAQSPQVARSASAAPQVPITLKWSATVNQTSSTAANPASRPTRAPEVRSPIVQVHNLEKTYTTARGALTLFKDLELEVLPGELVAIVGQSGAGKSTLLHILGALDTPTAGTVHCASTNVASLTAREGAAFRNRKIGYVWQFHYLLPEFSALENVAMPLLARGESRRDALAAASNWLAEVGLQDRSDHRPGELSGGEQQRIALARALVGNPAVLLADEPTGDLDETTAGRVFDLLERLHSSHGLTSIVVTHNLDLAARCTRTLRLEGGRLSALGQTSQTGPNPASA